MVLERWNPKIKSPYFETTNDYIRDSGLLSFFFFSCKRFALFVYKIWGGGVLSTGNMFLFFLGKNLDEINGHVIMYTVYDNILLFETILHAV